MTASNVNSKGLVGHLRDKKTRA